MEPLGGAEFAPQTTYLNTSSTGLIPARTVAAMKQALDAAAGGGPAADLAWEAVEEARAAFARLTGV
ncbi:aminotransferase, partial [Streptomyces sp. 2MCAF27]